MRHVREHVLFYFVVTLGVASFFVWIILWGIRHDTGVLTIAVLDVGQGDAILITTPHQRQLLIDGGPNKTVLSELGGAMPFYDRSIDAVIATHPHEDHIGGLIDVLKRYSVGMIMESGAPYESGAFREWKHATQKENATYARALRGMRIYLDKDIWFDVLLPASSIQAGPENIHDAMVVGKLVYGDVCFMFTGDMERDLEVGLLGDDIDCEVLKVGHHGSKTSTSDFFLDMVSPAIAVISDGEDNKFGHPHSVILDKLESKGIAIYRTDTDGRVTLMSDGKRVWKK